MTPRTEAGQAHLEDYWPASDGYRERPKMAVTILAIEAEAFALGKRLAEAHLNATFWSSASDAPPPCDYDLDSLQPDGYHDMTGNGDFEGPQRVKCAGAE